MQVWQPQIPTTQKNLAQSAAELDPGRSRSPTISLQSAELAYPKNDSKSAAYEIRTKSAQSGGLETNRSRESISALRQPVAVRRFSCEVPDYWASMPAQSRRRMFVAEGLAEREGFEPPIRLPVCRISSAVLSTTQPPLRGRRAQAPIGWPLCSQAHESAQGRAPSARHGRRAVRSDRKNAPDRSNRRGAPATWHSRRRPDRWRKG